MKFFNHKLILIAFISLLPFIISFLSPDLLHTSDGAVHLPRMGAYFKSLMDGQIPVRWAGDLNYGYGMPLFNFMYQLPYMVTSIFLASGFHLVVTFKIALWLSYVLSGVFMYLFTKELVADDFKAFVVSVFYLFAPFRLVELLIRGALGGVFAYTFLPLVLYAILKFNRNQTVRNFLLIGISALLLIISHNSLSMVFFAAAAVFAVIFCSSVKARAISMAGLMSGLGLAAFYWIPALLEHKYTYGDLFMKDMYRQHFPPMANLFIPNFTYNLHLLTAEISVQLGLFHEIALALAIGYLIFTRFKKTNLRKIMIYSLTLTAVSIFFTQPISLIFWEKVSLLRQFQFPWRFLAVAAFATPLTTLVFFELPKIFTRKIILVILLFTVASTAYYWYPREGFDKVKEADFWNYPLNTTYFGETDLIWSAGPAKSYPKNRIEVVSGTATISGLVKKTQIHTFSVLATGNATIADNTQYYPGWRVSIDHQQVPIEFQDENWRGLITFRVPSGFHNVRVEFGESRLRYISDGISVTFALAAVAAFIYATYFRKSAES